MSEFLTFHVEEEYDELKINDFLKGNCGLSSRFIRGAARDRRILVNGENKRKSYLVQKGDEIKIKISKKETQDIAPEKMDIDIVYEDDYILIVNKAPYMVVHPTKSHPKGTLANGVIYHFRQNGEDCIVRLANRLDMNTSGLVMIAKNQFAHMKISDFMQQNLIEKEYRTIVHGTLKEKKCTIDEPIGRPTMDSIIRTVMEDGQRSITHYEVIEEFEKGSLLNVKLETGRTHQIRVHLSHKGHPIFGDSLYGKEENEFINRQALHAYRLSFPHPVTGETIDVKCPIPKDMEELLEKLK